VTVVTDDTKRRAGGSAGSFASRAGDAILGAMTATPTFPACPTGGRGRCPGRRPGPS
jgi:hypothetical protein